MFYIIIKFICNTCYTNFMIKMKEFILIFDIPKTKNTLKTQVWRELRRKKCNMIQFSIWKSDKLNNLIEIARFIKKSGGSASILEEKFVF